MVSLPENATLPEYVEVVDAVYGVPNDRNYSLWDMLANMQKFSMRGIKGIRKNDREKVRLNMLIAMNWCTALMVRFHINIDEIIWNRFPYLCSYCGEKPCVCKAEKVAVRRKVVADDAARPRTLKEFQQMFRDIYPPISRTPEAAAIHLAEESGELAEAFQVYMGSHDAARFGNVEIEAADFYSCIFGVLNSFDIDLQEEMAVMFADNCHACHNAPCTCSFEYISMFKS